jgi:hypothetical protein
LAVIFEDLQADLPDALPVILQAGKNAKRVGDGVLAEVVSIRRARGLFFRRALEGV